MRVYSCLLSSSHLLRHYGLHCVALEFRPKSHQAVAFDAWPEPTTADVPLSLSGTRRFIALVVDQIKTPMLPYRPSRPHPSWLCMPRQHISTLCATNQMSEKETISVSKKGTLGGRRGFSPGKSPHLKEDNITTATVQLPYGNAQLPQTRNRYRREFTEKTHGEYIASAFAWKHQRVNRATEPQAPETRIQYAHGGIPPVHSGAAPPYSSRLPNNHLHPMSPDLCILLQNKGSHLETPGNSFEAYSVWMQHCLLEAMMSEISRSGSYLSYIPREYSNPHRQSFWSFGACRPEMV